MDNSFFVKLSIAAITGVAIFVGLNGLGNKKKKSNESASLSNNQGMKNNSNCNNKPYYSCKRNSVSNDLSKIQNTFGKISNCLGSAIIISDNLSSLVNDNDTNNYGYGCNSYYGNNNGGGLRSNASIIF